MACQENSTPLLFLQPLPPASVEGELGRKERKIILSIQKIPAKPKKADWLWEPLEKGHWNSFSLDLNMEEPDFRQKM